MSNYADKEWPGNNVPLFSKNAENGEKLAALVKKIEAECSFAELGFFGVQIREHIIKHFAEKRSAASSKKATIMRRLVSK